MDNSVQEMDDTIQAMDVQEMDGSVQEVDDSVQDLGNSYEDIEREWCQRLGIAYTSPARLAMWITETSCDGYTWRETTGGQPSVPRDREDLEKWREMAAWRHPHFDLNLLQLAILCGHPRVTQFLWHPQLTSEENYRDASSRLVNHPLHLIMRFSPGSLCWEAKELDDAIFMEEGTVDLTRAKLQAKAAKSQENENPENRMQASANTEEVNRVRELMSKFRIRLPDDAVFDTPERKSPMAHVKEIDNESVERLVYWTLKRLRGQNVQRSTLERLWALGFDLNRQGVPEKLFLQALAWCPRQARQEEFIWTSQLLWGVRDPQSLADRCLHVLDVHKAPSTQRELVRRIEDVARVLPRAHLLFMTRALIQEEKSQSGNANRLPYGQAAAVLWKWIGSVNLEDLCVQSFLECSHGDPSKVWELDFVPVPIKEQFRRPFWELYESFPNTKISTR